VLVIVRCRLLAFMRGVAQDANREIYFLYGNGQIMKLVVAEPASLSPALMGACAVIPRGAQRPKR
jgi:hypothetical protein